jgi:hypothetical protein
MSTVLRDPRTAPVSDFHLLGNDRLFAIGAEHISYSPAMTQSFVDSRRGYHSVGSLLGFVGTGTSSMDRKDAVLS